MDTNFLDTVNAHELGSKLQQARKRKGMTQADAAEVISTSRTTITAIEKGERRIKAPELVKLAQAYGEPVSHFVQESPKITSFDVQFRASLQRNSSRSRGEPYGIDSGEEEDVVKRIIYEWEGLCRDYLELEKITNSPLQQHYPLEYNAEGINIEAAGEGIALQERTRLGLGDGPIPLLRDVLEQEVGLRIFFLTMPAKFSEMFNYNKQLGGCLAINSNHPKERQRWSLAHGYLHFLVHRQKPIFHFDNQYTRKPESEKLADTFAKYFLMPTSGLLKRFSSYRSNGKFTPADLCTLADYYGVSVQAMALRLEELSLLPSGTWDNLKERGFRVRDVQKELGLDYPTETPENTNREVYPHFPLRYQHLAIEAFDQGLITEGRFARFLRVDRLEARRIANLLREHASGIDQASTLDLSATGNVPDGDATQPISTN